MDGGVGGAERKPGGLGRARPRQERPKGAAHRRGRRDERRRTMAKYTAEAYEWGGGQIAIYALGEGLVPAFSTLHVYPEQAAADFAAIHNGSDPVEDG